MAIKEISEDYYIEKAWNDFKRNFSKGFPELTHSEMNHLQNNLYMPPLILPGDIENKNWKHVCFSKKYRQKKLNNNNNKDLKNYSEDEADDNQSSERDSKDLYNEEDSSEKELVKAKTNSWLRHLPAIKEETSEENKDRRLKSVFDEDPVFQDEGDSLNEVATTN